MHGVTTKPGDYFSNGKFALLGIKPKQVTIPSKTVVKGAPQWGNVSLPGITQQDLIKHSLIGLSDYNVIISFEVIANNTARWVMVNTSDTPVTLPATTAIISAIKG